MLTQQEYAQAVIGKKIDMDGAYGAQCWDLFAHFCKTAGYPIISCTTTGYVRDIANNKATNGILNNFTPVSLEQIRDGDWVIWGITSVFPYSHIAMFRKPNGNHTGLFLGQNQGGRQVATEISLPYAGMVGIFRPKCYIQTASVPTNVPSNSSAKKSDDVIAREVLQGKWGNGSDRKARLAAAGYDYNVVQAIVNKLVK